MTRETVDRETPASFAISSNVKFDNPLSLVSETALIIYEVIFGLFLAFIDQIPHFL